MTISNQRNQVALRWALGSAVGAALLWLACTRTDPGEDLASSRAGLLISVGANQVGRLTSTGRGAARTFHQYDALGRAVASQHVLDGTSYVFRSAYGYPQGALGLCAGNACGPSGAPGTVVTSSTFPDGERVTYGYDSGGGAQTVDTRPCTDAPARTDGTCAAPAAASQSILRSVVRDARADAIQVAYGDGTRRDQCYNDGALCLGAAQPGTDLRLNQRRLTVVASGALLQSLAYQFDGNGNVVQAQDQLTPSLGLTAATYDSLDQLTSATTGSVTSSYGYDGLGNLTSREGQAQTYGGTGRGPHALATSGGLSYGYDADGQLTSRSDGLQITWDPEGMPALMTGGAAATPIQKWFSGAALWKKTVGGATTYYLPSLRVESGGLRKLFGKLAERAPDGTLRYYHPDHLGSSALVTTASAAVAHRAAYFPYGADRSTAGYTPAYTETFTPKYQFTFHEKEDGTGFYDFGARMYSAAIGRWLTPDPAAQGQNPYAYASNNPLSSVDPDGLADYKVFLPFGTDGNGANKINWDKVEATLKAYGHTLEVFQGDSATVRLFEMELADHDNRVAVLSHSEWDGDHNAVGLILAGGSSYGASAIGNVDGKLAVIPPGEIPGFVNADTLAVFSCNSTQLAFSFDTGNFVGMDGGKDHGSTFVAEATALQTFLLQDAAARPGNTTGQVQQATVDAANASFQAHRSVGIGPDGREYTDKDGDHVVFRPGPIPPGQFVWLPPRPVHAEDISVPCPVTPEVEPDLTPPQPSPLELVPVPSLPDGDPP